jgi:hypothetical protein
MAVRTPASLLVAFPLAAATLGVSEQTERAAERRAQRAPAGSGCCEGAGHQIKIAVVHEIPDG